MRAVLVNVVNVLLWYSGLDRADSVPPVLKELWAYAQPLVSAAYRCTNLLKTAESQLVY
jgi:hypothetical protein